MLYASFRKRSTICCWDLRGDVDAPLRVFDRALDAANHSQEGDDGTSGKHTAEMTNQKLRFDVDPGGHWLAVGDQVSAFYSFAFFFSRVPWLLTVRSAEWRCVGVRPLGVRFGIILP
jgi:hypothetical protein